MTITGIHFGGPHGLDRLLGQFAGDENLAVAPLEAQIFLSRDHDGAVAAVTGDDNGLGQGRVFLASDLFAEFS
jgi:hypothetical protein